MAMALNARQKGRFFRDGYLSIPGAVPPGLIASALDEIRRRAKRADGDYLSLLSSEPALTHLLSKTGLWRLAESLLGEGAVEPCTQAQIALCFPSAVGERPVKCHLDSWEADYDPKAVSRHTLTIGVLLSDVPGELMGNLTVFPGSHRLIARRVERHGLQAVRPGLAQTVRKVKPVQITGKKGDAVLLHYQLGHDKEKNFSAHTRFMAYFRLYHADAWRDGSEAYLRKAMSDIWLEWPGMGRRKAKASAGNTARRARAARARRSTARR